MYLLLALAMYYAAPIRLPEHVSIQVIVVKVWRLHKSMKLPSNALSLITQVCFCLRKKRESCRLLMWPNNSQVPQQSKLQCGHLVMKDGYNMKKKKTFFIWTCDLMLTLFSLFPTEGWSEGQVGIFTHIFSHIFMFSLRINTLLVQGGLQALICLTKVKINHLDQLNVQMTWPEVETI